MQSKLRSPKWLLYQETFQLSSPVAYLFLRKITPIHLVCGGLVKVGFLSSSIFLKIMGTHLGLGMDAQASAKRQKKTELRFDLDIANYPENRPDRSTRKSIKPRDPLYYIYTSGTTGPSKAAKFSVLKILSSSSSKKKKNETDNQTKPNQTKQNKSTSDSLDVH